MNTLKTSHTFYFAPVGIKAFVRFHLRSCSQALIILRRHSTAALNAQRIELRSGLRILTIQLISLRR